MLIESDDDSAVGLSSDIDFMRSSSHENEVSGKIRSDGESEKEYEVRAVLMCD
jgi:hypothetical protein